MIRQGTKIAFCGAGGTGKTTSAIVIADMLNLKCLESASRKVYNKNGLTEDKVMQMSPQEKWELQSDIFDEKIKMDDQNFSFVADRTLIDHYSYCLMYCGDTMRNNDFFEYENRVRKHMKATYSKIFYFPIGYWTPKEDGVRSNQEAWQSAIDAIIVGYIVRWQLPAITVPQTEGPLCRSQFIIDHINNGQEQVKE